MDKIDLVFNHNKTQPSITCVHNSLDVPHDHTYMTWQFCVSYISIQLPLFMWHDDIIKWKHIPRYWPFVLGIHWSPVNSPHKSQWRGALMFSLICTWLNCWVNNREAGDLRCHHTHYDIIVMEVTVMDNMGKIIQFPTTTKYNKAQTMCIILGIYQWVIARKT